MPTGDLKRRFLVAMCQTSRRPAGLSNTKTPGALMSVTYTRPWSSTVMPWGRWSWTGPESPLEPSPTIQCRTFLPVLNSEWLSTLKFCSPSSCPTYL